MYNRPLFFIARAQPMRHGLGEGYDGSMLTLAERRLLVEFIDGNMQDLPLTIDHADLSAPMQAVPLGKRIGFVMYLLIDGAQHVLAVGLLYADRPETRMIEADLASGDPARRWGVSFWTDLVLRAGTDDSVERLQVTHLGVTQNPAFGAEDSWIFQYFTDLVALRRVLRENYLSQPGAYAGRRLRSELAGSEFDDRRLYTPAGGLKGGARAPSLQYTSFVSATMSAAPPASTAPALPAAASPAATTPAAATPTPPAQQTPSQPSAAAAPQTPPNRDAILRAFVEQATALSAPDSAIADGDGVDRAIKLRTGLNDYLRQGTIDLEDTRRPEVAEAYDRLAPFAKAAELYAQQVEEATKESGLARNYIELMAKTPTNDAERVMQRTIAVGAGANLRHMRTQTAFEESKKRLASEMDERAKDKATLTEMQAERERASAPRLAFTAASATQLTMAQGRSGTATGAEKGVFSMTAGDLYNVLRGPVGGSTKGVLEVGGARYSATPSPDGSHQSFFVQQ
jgi:hypothetical protein